MGSILIWILVFGILFAIGMGVILTRECFELETIYTWLTNASDIAEQKEKKKKNKIKSLLKNLCIFLVSATSVVCAQGLTDMYKHSLYQDVISYTAQKEVIEAALENQSLLELEKVELLQNTLRLNIWLEQRQYAVNQWYGCDLPKEILSLEPIEMKN